MQAKERSTAKTFVSGNGEPLTGTLKDYNRPEVPDVRENLPNILGKGGKEL